MGDMSPPPGQIPDLVARVAAGDREAMVELLVRYRDRLRRMVALRLDPRLRGRVDASDVIQDGYLDAMRRLDEFIQDPAVSQMSNGDAAAVLGLGAAAASKRYTRALGRIGALLAELPGGVDGDV
jgi:DNA-directed RNA polymerase specialized sigma24 family protein